MFLDKLYKLPVFICDTDSSPTCSSAENPIQGFTLDKCLPPRLYSQPSCVIFGHDSDLWFKQIYSIACFKTNLEKNQNK